MKNDFIVALVPAYNEEKNIRPVLEVLKNISVLNQVLVIDDGSKDQTAKVAQEQGFDVLRLEKNGGKAAIKSFFIVGSCLLFQCNVLNLKCLFCDRLLFLTRLFRH